MNNKFIFIFLDDSSLDVIDPTSNRAGKYEGIDVANNEYTFFDNKLRKLLPRFTKPNQTATIFGLLTFIVSGEYELDPQVEVSKEEFIIKLNNLSAINPNPWFQTIEKVREYANNLSL